MKVIYVNVGSVAAMRQTVAKEVDRGFDIYGPMVTTHMYGLCMPMVEHASIYDYALVSAESLGELEQKVNELIEVGFDLLHGVVVFQDLEDGQYLQWMCKMREMKSIHAGAAVEYAASC